MLSLASAASCRALHARAPTHGARQRGTRLVSGAAPAGGSGGGDAASGGEEASSGELPPELQNLCISEDGQHLIDQSTGKVVNEFGATRFDVAVRAMRGEFDPPAYQDNTERSPSLLLDSLTQFPSVYDFQLVVKPAALAAGSSSSSSTDGSSSSSSGQSGATQAEAVLERYRQLIADTAAADISREACTVKERLGGKFLSLCIPARVQAAHVVDLVWAELEKDPAVTMKW